MARKSTKEEFVAKARARHGDRYGYSRVVYVNNATPVLIECPEHGLFRQSPNNHLKTFGCKKCGNIARRLSTSDWILKARSRHGDKYDYSKVVYKTANGYVDIICPEHGLFRQKAITHTTQSGCPKCGKIRSGKTRTKKPIVTRPISVCGEHTKVTFINCVEHGNMYVASKDDIYGGRCSKCIKGKLKPINMPF